MVIYDLIVYKVQSHPIREKCGSNEGPDKIIRKYTIGMYRNNLFKKSTYHFYNCKQAKTSSITPFVAEGFESCYHWSLQIEWYHVNLGDDSDPWQDQWSAGSVYTWGRFVIVPRFCRSGLMEGEYRIRCVDEPS